MPDPFGDDEASPDAQVIGCIVNHIDTPLFVKPIGQRATTQQWLIQGDEPIVNLEKFDTPIINSRTVSSSRNGKVSFVLNPFIIHVQMPELTLLDVFLNLA